MPPGATRCASAPRRRSADEPIAGLHPAPLRGSLPDMDPTLALVVALAFVAGGVLKGATGYGAPLLAVPVMAVSVDLAFAITIFSIPNILPNLWQAWSFRAARLSPGFLLRFAGAAALGSAAGAWALANIDTDLLSLVLVAIILTYIGFRLWQPDWTLPMGPARWLALPAGLFGGMFQTAAGLSAPVSLTFLSAMRLPRETFVQTISTFFAAVGLVQIPALWSLGYLTPVTAALSASALLPLALGMWLGARLARHLSPESFQRIVLVILVGLAARLAWSALG